MTALAQIVDPYARQARLAPALCAIFPIAILIFVWFPALQSLLGGVVSLACSFGIILWVSQIARDAGKRREPALFAMWGGKPSVTLLRHCDNRIDPNTKARYRDFLMAHVFKLSLPSAEEEAADPHKADEAYESVTNWLLTQTRDTKKFALLFQENISYGFRRNLWGMKPFGVTLSLLAALCSTGVIIYRCGQAGHGTPTEVMLATAFVWCLFIAWVFIVRPNWVRIPADAYARQLLAACDTLRGDQKPRRNRQSG